MFLRWLLSPRSKAEVVMNNWGGGRISPDPFPKDFAETISAIRMTDPTPEQAKEFEEQQRRLAAQKQAFEDQNRAAAAEVCGSR
jgi:hypothetical protein